MAYCNHIVINANGDVVGRINHPHGRGFEVNGPFHCINVYLTDDEEYDIFYSLPEFTDLTDYGYMGM